MVFSVLDSDKITVLGYKELDLIGQGMESITIEIPVPDLPKSWVVYPSAYWFVDKNLRYTEDDWTQKSVITVVDATPGHTQSSCSDESLKCHSG